MERRDGKKRWKNEIEKCEMRIKRLANIKDGYQYYMDVDMNECYIVNR